MRHVVGVILLCLACVAASPVQGEDIDREVRAIADQLRCPVCRGVPITESPAELAQDMMQIIRAKLADGATEAQILQYFADRYGEWILLKPKPHGMNLAVWLLPIACFVGGVAVVMTAIIRWSRRASAGPG